MIRFFVGQKWVSANGLRAEVIEISDEGRRGIVVITNEHGEEMSRDEVNASQFQSSWLLA